MHTPLGGKRAETAAGSTMNPSQRTRTEMGTDMYQVENIGSIGSTIGPSRLLSTTRNVHTYVVIGDVTTAYWRLQRTKEYTKADYRLRAKSQTSSP